MILPTDHLALESGAKTHPLPSMTLLKHVVVDLAGLALVLVCQPRRIAHWYHLPCHPISSLFTNQAVVAYKTVSQVLPGVQLRLRGPFIPVLMPAVPVRGGLNMNTAPPAVLVHTVVAGLSVIKI